MVVAEPINKVNLERLTNGIYAFTMTLMIRNISSPAAGTLSDATTFFRFINTTVYAVFDFIGAFLILGMFWLFYYQMFHRMKTFDSRFLYIHLLSLMVVVFVPFTQSFTSDGSEIPIADIVFQINYLALAVLLAGAWYYACRARPSLLVPELTGAEAVFLQKKFLVPVGVSIFGITILLSGFPYFDVIYLFPFAIIAIFFHHPPGVPAE
ncbi:TMEM175 family protein [uncultured Methanoregula sp.]|uniref:TMEM175 family protein n=1 Tax=uncultured Methanoregula sp. TaxID=1005933 RepID=UPI002AAC18DE|nr:TMEM175 family protein [uncultured Methanoregula sp.]